MKQTILSRVQSLQRYMTEKPFFLEDGNVDPQVLDRLKEVWSHITDWFILSKFSTSIILFTEIVVLAENHMLQVYGDFYQD